MGMSEHAIDWFLVFTAPGEEPMDGAPGPLAQLTCTAPAGAPCRDSSWEEVLDTSDIPLKDGECYATAMIEATGASLLWAGAGTHQISGREIDVKPVGDDWVWKYADEEWATPTEEPTATGAGVGDVAP